MAVGASAATNTASAVEAKKIVLAGNPNVGKSALFNALTGMNADVSNYPGTTIDVAHGKIGADDLSDTPGIYGVSSFNDEERIARKMILEAQAVVNVVSALSLDRDLFLTLQLLDMGMPMIVVVNQCDEAIQRGLAIDFAKLESELGVPLLQTVAVKGEGVGQIESALGRATTRDIAAELKEYVDPLIEAGCDRALSVLAVEGDAESADSLETAVVNLQATIYRARRRRVNDLAGRVAQYSDDKPTFSAHLGRMLLHPVYGSISCFVVCYLLFYQLLGVWIAGDLVNLTEKAGFRVYYEPVVRRTVATVVPAKIRVGNQTFAFTGGTIAEPALAQKFDAARNSVAPDSVAYDFWAYPGVLSAFGNALAGEYGVLTLTVTYLLGLLFPLVLAFYFGLSLLEDSGYLPRLAVLVDRILCKFGLNGRAIIPLILGLGCVTMATVTTRLLSSNREKIIATALLGVAIPCSAQLGIVSGTLAKVGGFLPWAVYGGVVGTILAITGVLLNKLLPGKPVGLLIDLPPMRLPRMSNVLKKTWTKSYNFLKESVPMFALAGLVVTVAQITGLLETIIAVLKPITVSLLQLPADPRIPTTFILGIVRRDFAAFGLTDVALTPVQAVVAMIVITLFVPCIATLGIMIKERGPKIAFSIWVGSWVAAFAIGGMLARLLPPVFAALHH
jgi:ferrous iron transport protein B